MNIWTVANQKGGVGKTTTAVSLGGLLAARGERTLLVDLDPHGSLSAYFGLHEEATERSVYQLFQDAQAHTSELMRPSAVPNLGILPSVTALATLERHATPQAGRGLVLQRALQQLRGEVDHVVIDCPPVLGILMINALAASRQLIIPVQTEFLALKGLERMIASVSMIRRSLKSALPYLIVPTLYDKRTRAGRHTLEALQREYPDDLWELVIPVDTQFREASQYGVPIHQLAPMARGTLAYGALLDTLMGSSALPDAVGYGR